jgi:hypothetical protein
LTSRSPWDVVVDYFGPKALRRDRILAHASEYLDRLLEANTSRVAGDLGDRLQDTRRVLEEEVRARLTVLVTSTTQVITHARQLQACGEPAVRAEVDRLAALRRRIDTVSATWASGTTG